MNNQSLAVENSMKGLPLGCSIPPVSASPGIQNGVADLVTQERNELHTLAGLVSALEKSLEPVLSAQAASLPAIESAIRASSLATEIEINKCEVIALNQRLSSILSRLTL
ncbi:MAG TPA: hypothetical protein PK671_00405 [Candidatus Obscuribacter sp.]|nr:hypothetical protein [Candidatus Obscuribacter sp.]HMY51370.1 hypothetical protein [Candidatus Obscuribacter sp.]